MATGYCRECGIAGEHQQQVLPLLRCKFANGERRAFGSFLGAYSLPSQVQKKPKRPAKRLSGELKTFEEATRCSGDRIMQAFSDANYKHMDLIAKITASRITLGE